MEIQYSGLFHKQYKADRCCHKCSQLIILGEINLVRKFYSVLLLLFFLIPLMPLSTTDAQQTSMSELEATEHRDIDFFVDEIPGSAGEGFEPHIVAGPGIYGEEWLYIDSPTGIGGGQSGNLWISKDHGDTWEPHEYGRNALGSGDSYTAIGADGTIYYTDLYLWSSTIDTSKDGGNTWIRNPLATVTRVGDRQWLSMGPTVGTLPGSQSETLYMVYNDIPLGLVIQRSQWSSRGFMWTMGNNRQAVTSNVGSRDHFCVDQVDGTIYLPNKESGMITVYVSQDGADSFTRKEVTSDAGDAQNIFIASDVDLEGNLYLTWSTQEDVFMAVSQDKGDQWVITNVTDTPGTRVLPWITVGDPGRVALTWYDTNATGEISDEVEEDVEWGTYVAITTNAFAENVSFVISPVIENVHTGTIRTTGTGGNADRDLGDFFTCDVDQYGRLIITFGMDGDDGPDARQSMVMFAKQLEGPFLKKDVGPVAMFENQTYKMTVEVDASRTHDMSGQRITEYLWDWGDGTNSTGVRSDHAYEDSGTYEITLKVVNELDMRSSVSSNIVVTKEKEGGSGIILIVFSVGLIAAGVGAVVFYMRRKASNPKQK